MSDAATTALPPDQPGLTPLKLIQTYTAEDWEAFIEEWTEGFDPAYDQVVRIGGAGDLGRDVIGHIEPATVRPRPCDVYQCKHYDHPLRATDVYTELGKLCVYTHRGDYPVPRKYRFVPPRGVGPGLYNLLNNQEQLRLKLIENWDKYCKTEISDANEFPLEGTLKQYVEHFDFSIVWFLTPTEVVNQHSETKYWSRRFKTDPPKRPDAGPVPATVQKHEMAYVTCLLNAYSHHLNKIIALSELPGAPQKIQTNFSQSRGNFFLAEALSRFSRDHFPGAFENVKQNVLDGVFDVTQASHKDGFECLLEVMKQAAALPLPESGLTPYVGTADKKGVCHHLANDGKLKWVDS